MRSDSRRRRVRGAVVVGACALVGVLATAARADNPNGVYEVATGKLSIKVQSLPLLTGSASLPNLKALNQQAGLKGQMTFMPTPGQPENFELALPPLPLIGTLSIPGMWTADAGSPKFAVEMITDADVQQTVALLNQMLSRTDITGQLSKHGFAGKVSSGNQVKATFGLTLAITVPPVKLTIKLAGNVGGSYVGPVPTMAAAPVTTNVRDFLTGFVVDEVRDLAAQ